MNPPFSLPNKEYEFVSHALAQMEHGELLFSILPYSVMAKSGAAQIWRRNLLADHTLLSVVTLPIDIFYPVSAPPVGVVIKSGSPQPQGQRTLWVRAETDGYLKSKGKRLPSDLTTNQLESAIPILRSFLNDPSIDVPNQPRYMKAAPVDLSDPLLELIPEAYLDQEPLSEDAMLRGVDSILRGFCCVPDPQPRAIVMGWRGVNVRRVALGTLFAVHSGDYHAVQRELDEGLVPLVSCGDVNDGLGWALRYFHRTDSMSAQ